MGILGLKFNRVVANYFGRITWVERYLGSGNSGFFIILVLSFMVFFGIFMIFGFGDDFGRFITSPLRSIFE
jgi:hypothetical protein